MNEKLLNAIKAIDGMYLAKRDIRASLEFSINGCGYVSEADPWVVAALNARDDNMLEIALEFFLAELKEGSYDMPNVEPLASP